MRGEGEDRRRKRRLTRYGEGSRNRISSLPARHSCRDEFPRGSEERNSSEDKFLGERNREGGVCASTRGTREGTCTGRTNGIPAPLPAPLSSVELLVARGPSAILCFLLRPTSYLTALFLFYLSLSPSCSDCGTGYLSNLFTVPLLLYGITAVFDT